MVLGVWSFVLGAFVQVLLGFEGLDRFWVFGFWFLARLCKILLVSEGLEFFFVVWFFVLGYVYASF